MSTTPTRGAENSAPDDGTAQVGSPKMAVSDSTNTQQTGSLATRETPPATADAPPPISGAPTSLELGSNANVPAVISEGDATPSNAGIAGSGSVTTHYDEIINRLSGATTTRLRQVRVADGHMRELCTHVLGEDRSLRVLIPDANLGGPSVDFAKEQIEAAVSFQTFEAIKGPAFRASGNQARRLNDLVKVGGPVMKEGAGMGMAYVLYEAMRLAEYGLDAVGLSDGNFWTNFGIEQAIVRNPAGRPYFADFFDGYPEGDFLGRFVSPQLAHTMRLDLVYPEGLNHERGICWLLSVLMCQGHGKGVNWWASFALDLRPPTAARLPYLVKVCVAFLSERATVREKALAQTIFHATQGIQANLGVRGTNDPILAADAEVVAWTFPDHAAVPGAYIEPIPDVPPRIDKVTNKATSALAAYDAAAAKVGEVQLELEDPDLGKEEKRALNVELDILIDEAADAEFYSDAADRASAPVFGRKGEADEWLGVIAARGTGVNLVPRGMTADYALPMCSSLGWLARVSNRIANRTAGGMQLGFDEDDSLYTLAFLFSDAGASFARADFYSTCPNTRNWIVPGPVDEAWHMSDSWPEFLASTLLPKGLLRFDTRPDWESGPNSCYVQRQMVPPSWEVAGRPPEWMPPWLVPNIVPLAVVLVAFPMADVGGTPTVHPPADGYTSGGVAAGVGGGWVSVTSASVSPGNYGRWIRDIRQEYYRIFPGGRTQPLVRSVFTNLVLTDVRNMSNFVVPYASNLIEEAFTSTSSWLEVASPMQLMGVVAYCPSGRSTLPNTAPLLLGSGRKYRFRGS